jgi:hypothetical protein
MSSRLPTTVAEVRVFRQSWQEGRIEGEVQAGHLLWQFVWNFGKGELRITPSLGRALIKDALNRFLVQKDYQLEPGGDYSFNLRAKL